MSHAGGKRTCHLLRRSRWFPCVGEKHTVSRRGHCSPMKATDRARVGRERPGTGPFDLAPQVSTAAPALAKGPSPFNILPCTPTRRVSTRNSLIHSPLHSWLLPGPAPAQLPAAPSPPHPEAPLDNTPPTPSQCPHRAFPALPPGPSMPHPSGLFQSSLPQKARLDPPVGVRSFCSP